MSVLFGHLFSTDCGQFATLLLTEGSASNGDTQLSHLPAIFLTTGKTF
jgi:hypothetical protein